MTFVFASEKEVLSLKENSNFYLNAFQGQRESGNIFFARCYRPRK
ncbi:hypothetical protein MJ1HA_1813 [Metallosphaera sedula]|nr:hypothetical protein MJ1HA_1813 [Metallosphaera sedula]